MGFNKFYKKENMKKIPTITIATPAHNEQANIANFLTSLFRQKKRNYILEKIIICLDGCTDNTFKIVSKIAETHPEICILNDGLRLGKVRRSNQLYKLNKSDILICLDADVYLKDNIVLEELVKPFSDPKVGLVGGHDTAAPGKTLIQKLAVSGSKFWEKARIRVNEGQSVLNHHGSVSCLSRSFAKKAYIYPGIIADDIYLYYQAIFQGYKFSFAHKAYVYFAAPATLSDYLLQMSRYRNQLSRISPYYPSVYQDHCIGWEIKAKVYLECLLEAPMYFPLVIIFQLITKIIVMFYREDFKNGMWRIATSSKNNAVSI
jgi:cellulose synthase/poly-beta-1,6-N-acetylglucosamine synthase-like glycosyltransferase